MRKYFICFLVAVLCLVGVCHAFLTPAAARQEVEPLSAPNPISDRQTEIMMLSNETVATPEIIIPEEPEPEPLATQEEIELLAILTMAEAEGESELGQRLVIDTVLNRVDDPHFPDTISEVVWQKNQFSGMYGERIKKCYVMDSLVQLVLEELENRTNYDVVFFRTQRYSDYGVPMFQEDHHYFSSYE